MGDALQLCLDSAGIKQQHSIQFLFGTIKSFKWCFHLKKIASQDEIQTVKKHTMVGSTVELKLMFHTSFCTGPTRFGRLRFPC